MKQQLLTNVCTHLAVNSSPSAHTDVDESTIPDNFVYYRDDGEKSGKHLWKPFKVPLLDKDGEQCYDDNGEPIIIIA